MFSMHEETCSLGLQDLSHPRCWDIRFTPSVSTCLILYHLQSEGCIYLQAEIHISLLECVDAQVAKQSCGEKVVSKPSIWGHRWGGNVMWEKGIRFEGSFFYLVHISLGSVNHNNTGLNVQCLRQMDSNRLNCNTSLDSLSLSLSSSFFLFSILL